MPAIAPDAPPPSQCTRPCHMPTAHAGNSPCLLRQQAFMLLPRCSCTQGFTVREVGLAEAQAHLQQEHLSSTKEVQLGVLLEEAAVGTAAAGQ